MIILICDIWETDLDIEMIKAGYFFILIFPIHKQHTELPSYVKKYRADAANHNG